MQCKDYLLRPAEPHKGPWVSDMGSHRGQANAGLEPLDKVSNLLTVMKHLVCAGHGDGCLVQFATFDPHTHLRGKDFDPQLRDEKGDLERLRDL